MASMASISDDESIGVCALFPNRFVNGAEVEQKNLAIKPRLAKGDEMALVKTMKIKLPAGSPSPREVARTLGATGAEVRSVDRLLDQISVLIVRVDASLQRNQELRKQRLAGLPENAPTESTWSGCHRRVRPKEQTSFLIFPSMHSTKKSIWHW